MYLLSFSSGIMISHEVFVLFLIFWVLNDSMIALRFLLLSTVLMSEYYSGLEKIEYMKLDEKSEAQNVDHISEFQ